MDYLMYESAGKADRMFGAFGGAGLSLAASSPFPGASRWLLHAKVTAKVPRGPSQGGEGQRCPHMPRLLPGGPGTHPRCRARGGRVSAGECPSAVLGCVGSDNDKERIWVRALAGLRWGCGEGWLVWRLREQLFLGTLRLWRVGRGWASIPGNRSLAQLPRGTGVLVSGPRPALTLASGTRGVIMLRSFCEDG